MPKENKLGNSREQFEDALRDLKINWMKYVFCWKAIGHDSDKLSPIYATSIFCIRCGVLTGDELEEEYGENVSFLLAKLKLLGESENVSIFAVQFTCSGYVWVENATFYRYNMLIVCMSMELL